MKTLREYISSQVDQDPAFARLQLDSQVEIDLALELTAVRKALGLTQRAVAERMGIAQPAVARYEAGGRSPTVAVVARFAAALGVSITVTPDSSVQVAPWDLGHPAAHGLRRHMAVEIARPAADLVARGTQVAFSRADRWPIAPSPDASSSVALISESHHTTVQVSREPRPALAAADWETMAIQAA